VSPGRARVLLIALAGWLLTGLVLAGPASAHAELAATTPGEGAQLDEAPAEVTLQFTEPVSLGSGYVRVLDGSGERVDTGDPAVLDDTVTLPLRADLPDDGYLVTYRVISADSHPVSGAFGFVVGEGQPVDAGVADAAEDSDPLVTGLTAVARWLGYAGLALGLGVPAFLLLCWPAGWDADRPRRLALLGAALIAAGGLLAFLLQGPYTAGTGLGGIVDPTLIGATASSSFGITLLVRVGLALLLLAVLRAAPRRAALNLGVVVAAGLVVTTAAVGHPVAGPSPALAVAITAIHVAAMTLWTGGLAAMLAGLLRPGVRAGDLGAALPRFSGLALGSVVALVLTGVVQAVREVGSPTALFGTTYGWVLVAKVAVLVVVLGAAGVSRVWVQQHLGAPRPRRSPRRLTAHAFAATGDAEASAEPGEVDEAAGARAAAQAEAAVADVGPFRRSVVLEAGLLAVVLALSAVLTGTAPARSAAAEPYAATLEMQGSADAAGSVQVSVDPARPGPNTLHVYLFDSSGRLTQPADIRVTITEQQQEIGPIEVDLAPAGPGHYVAEGLDIPGAGTWTLVVAVRLDEFTATTARTSFPVR
jgi:copper transport protein